MRKEGKNQRREKYKTKRTNKRQTNDGYKRGEYVLTWTKLNLEMYFINKQKVFE